MLKKTIGAALIALANKSWALPATTALSASVASVMIGHDPMPWIIGGFGAAIMHVKMPSTTRPNAIANAGISIFAGGLIAPLASDLVASQYATIRGADYAIAFVLSCAWPWILTTGKAFCEKRGWL